MKPKYRRLNGEELKRVILDCLGSSHAHGLESPVVIVVDGEEFPHVGFGVEVLPNKFALYGERDESIRTYRDEALEIAIAALISNGNCPQDVWGRKEICTRGKDCEKHWMGHCRMGAS